MDLEFLGVSGFIALIVTVIVVVLVAIALTAGAIASWLGLSGVLWWAVSIVLFLLISGILAMISRVGQK